MLSSKLVWEYVVLLSNIDSGSNSNFKTLGVGQMRKCCRFGDPNYFATLVGIVSCTVQVWAFHNKMSLEFDFTQFIFHDPN